MGELDLPGMLSALGPGAALSCEFDWYFSEAEIRAGRIASQALWRESRIQDVANLGR